MRWKCGPTALAALGVVWITFSGTSARANPGDIYNLDTLGGSSSSGHGVNDTGQVAGESLLAGDSAGHAVRLDSTPGGPVLRDLGVFGGSFSQGFGINQFGQVAGASDTATVSHAFRYDGTPGAGGVMRDLGTLNPSFPSFGYAINDAGQVTGRSGLPSSVEHAFRYDGTPGAGGVMRDLGTLGGSKSQGRGINASGQVAGYSYTSGDGNLRAFRYDGTPGAGGVMRNLGTLLGDSAAYAINASGQVAGYSNIGIGNPHAFRYDGTPGAGGVMHDLGTLGGISSVGYGINDEGFVVGYSAKPTGIAAAVWRPNSSIVDLDAWLDATNPTLGALWSLTQADDVSNTGLVTGYGNYNDGPGGLSDGMRAFLLDASSLIPEPSGLALLGVGAMALIRRRGSR